MIDALSSELSNFDALKLVKADRDAWLRLFQETDPSKSEAQQLADNKGSHEKADNQNTANQGILVTTEESLSQQFNTGVSKEASSEKILDLTSVQQKLSDFDSLDAPGQVEVLSRYLDHLRSLDNTQSSSSLNFGYLASGQLLDVTLPKPELPVQKPDTASVKLEAMTQQQPFVLSRQGKFVKNVTPDVNRQAYIVANAKAPQTLTSAASKQLQATIVSNPIVTFKAEQTWQQRKFTVIESESTLKLYLRDYRLSDSQKTSLYLGLLEEFNNEGKRLEVTINGQRRV